MRATLVVLLLAFAVPISAFAQDSSRAPVPVFKGMELYSWRDRASGTWCYSLLGGTNRTKTLAEIQDPRAIIPSVVELQKRLARLADHEQVFWALRPNLPELSRPARETVDDLVKFAAEHSVTLHIDR
jgi:hypothetical protein